MRRGRLLGLISAGMVATSVLQAAASDIGAEPPPLDSPGEGVSCGALIVRSFPSVWQGRFQGGYSHYVGEGGPVVLDWRDERLCFPDRGSCRHYIADMRRDFHKPEGFFTCLPIR